MPLGFGDRRSGSRSVACIDKRVVDILALVSVRMNILG